MIPLAMLVATLGCPPLAPCPLLDPASRTQPDSIVMTPTRPDTGRRRAKAEEVSDFYELRLRVHRYASYATIPLFVAQSVAGNQLLQADKSGAEKPGWARGVHGAGAAGLGILFTLNTVTGVWNLWDSRHNEVGRTKRIVHSVLLLAADGGFALAAGSADDDAEESQGSRNRHRDIAYASMGTALVGYSVMLVGGH